MATKTFGDKVRSGAIYFRYPGQSTDIAYGEMATLLSERDRKAQQALLQNLNIFTERAPGEVAVIDLKKGQLLDGGEPLELSSELVRQLNVIREGEFVERDGAPAVRLIGDATVVQRDKGASPQIVRGFVSDQSVVRNFARREPVKEPAQYFFAAINSSSDWLPIFRWMREAGLTHADAVAIVEAESLTPVKRQRAIERLSGRRSARQDPSRSIQPTLEKLMALEVPPITNDRDLRRVMQAVRMVASADRAQMEILWKALESGYEFAWAAKNGGDLQSYVKSAAARLDELSEAQEAVSGRADSQLSDD